MDSKGRTLYILRYLYDHTDDAHAVSSKELIDYCHGLQLTVNRNTLHSDIVTLNQTGFEIATERRDTNYYRLISRPLEKVEARMLIDAVLSAQFISESRSRELIEKLVRLSGVSEDGVHVPPTHKTDNADLYYAINELEAAIAEKRKVKFHYYEYLPNKQKAFRHDGDFYIVSPYALMWKEDRYYMLGWNEAREAVNTFRVDLLADVRVTEEEAHACPEDFSTEHYGKDVTKMYDGTDMDIVLLCPNKLMGKLIDKFGTDFETEAADGEHFKAHVRTNVSKTFFGWLFQYAGEIDLIGPDEAVTEYRQRLSLALGEKADTGT